MEASGLDEVFGRYRLRGLLGAGGMGQVFRAFDTELHRDVAIKVLPAQVSVDAGFVQRFRREARAAAGLGEPHVVPIHDSGEIEGRLFIAMQLIAGVDLGSLLGAEGPLPAGRAVDVVEQAAAALDAAHEAGLVHRDVKPANLLVTPKDFVYLIDFGIARAAGETALTGTGGAIGTLAYMAPERFTRGQVDKRADVYALACVLFQCLTGRTPYPAVNAEQQMFAHVAGPPPRPSQVGVGPEFDSVIARGMAMDPDQRYQSAGELAGAARAALHGDPHAAPDDAGRTYAVPAHATVPAPTMLAPVPRPRRRRIAALAAVTVLAVAVATGIGLWVNKHANNAANGAHPTNTISASTPRTVTDTIKVGRALQDLAVDPTTHAVYVLEWFSNSVSVIDAATNAVTATVNVGRMPAELAIDPAKRTAYIINSGMGTLSVFDMTTNAVTATIDVRKAMHGVAVDPSTHTVYAASSTASDASSVAARETTVSVINPATNTVTAAIDVGKDPSGIAVDPGTRAVYTANDEDGTVSVIDTVTNTVAATVKVGRAPSAVAVDATRHAAYVVNGIDNTVSVIDTRSHAVIATVNVGKYPRGVAIDPGAHTAFCTNSQDGTLSVIDTVTNTVAATVNVGKSPYAVAVDPTKHTAFVANSGEDGTVAVIEPAR